MPEKVYLFGREYPERQINSRTKQWRHTSLISLRQSPCSFLSTSSAGWRLL